MRVLFAVILLALTAFAGEMPAEDSSAFVQDTAAIKQDSVESKQDVAVAQDSLESGPIPIRHSIPLPRLSAYTGYGLLAGLAAGVYSPTEDCDCLGVWQGQFEFFYTDWISAGFDVRFFGGNLDKDMSVLYQRYRGNVRFHFPKEDWDWYVGPIMGFESTDLQGIREEWHNRDDEWWIPGATKDDELEIEDCEKMFSLDGFSIGIDVGAGISVFNIFGITGSVLYEYNFGGAQLLTISPGIAYNMQEVWPWAKKNLSATWLSIETGFQRFFNRSVDSWALSAYFGFVVGF